MTARTAPGVIVLSDCVGDSNASARLASRVHALFGTFPALLGLSGPRPTLAAGLTLYDTLTARELLAGEDGAPLVVLVNVAPRTDKTWENGAPFCYFWYRNRHLVVTTYDDETLSLIGRHLGIMSLGIFETDAVMKAALAWTNLSEQEVEFITKTQFRSLWFQTLLASWLYKHVGDPALEGDTIPLLPADEEPVVRFIDIFGNCKTALLPENINFVDGKRRQLRLPSGQTTTVTCHTHLSDVPPREKALVIGSSLAGFVDLVVQGESAEALGYQVGSRLNIL